jgi:hypothetical protein
MPHAAPHIAALLVSCLAAALSSAGCGQDTALVRIDGAPNASISSSTLDHWMKAAAGADFRETIGAEGPRGLVSEPADNLHCIDAAKLVAPRSFFNQLQLRRTQLAQMCRELHRSIKAQALSFLIAVRWATLESAERGLDVGNGAVKRALEQFRRGLSTGSTVASYIKERQWSLADLLYLLRYGLLSERLGLPPDRAHSGGPLFQTARSPGQGQRRLLARTHCTAEALVAYCDGYRAPSQAPTAPATILRRLVLKSD